MATEYLPCEKCGHKTRRLFLARHPGWLTTAAVSLLGCVAIYVLGISNSAIRVGVTLTLTISGLALIRMRCLNCEPER